MRVVLSVEESNLVIGLKSCIIRRWKNQRKKCRLLLRVPVRVLFALEPMELTTSGFMDRQLQLAKKCSEDVKSWSLVLV